MNPLSWPLGITLWFNCFNDLLPQISEELAHTHLDMYLRDLADIRTTLEKAL